MSAIKDGRLPIVLDKERHLLFSLNVIDEMQDKFGGFDKLAEMLKGKDGIKNLRWLLTLLLNEGADDGEEQLTEKQVGKMIHTGNFNEVKTAIFKAFAMGNSGTTEPPQDDEKTHRRARSNRPCPPALYRRYASTLAGTRSVAHDTV
jgi:hypothetical protein